MDPARVIEALRDTLSDEKQASASKTLDEMHKIINFAPTLLSISLEESLDGGVRHAAVLYLKNISKWWNDPDPEKSDQMTFSIHEQDRQSIRNSIVGAVVAATFPLQAQLKSILSTIIKNDFPDRFPQFTEQLKFFLSSTANVHWNGALVCFHAFVKEFESKRNDNKNMFTTTVREFFPVVLAAMTHLVSNKVEDSLTLQVLILKSFYAFIYFHFPLDVMSKESLGQWVDLFCAVLSDFSIQSSEVTHPFWKAKKWALKVIHRLFTRYGNPSAVSKKHRPFAEWYMKAFAHPIINVLLGICETYRQKSFVSKPVLSLTLQYFTVALVHSFVWKILKSHFLLIVREVIFPLLSHSEEDAALWQDDPIEYIRIQAAEWDRDMDPSFAAFDLLEEACIKRRGVLNNIMPFCMHILTSDSLPIEKDAVLRMYGAVAELLLKKEVYKNHLEPFLLTHVLPTLHAPEGYRRARAYWLLGKLSDASFNDQNVLSQVVEEVQKALFRDPESPVQAFAALCLADLIRSQEHVHQLLTPHLRDLLLQMLKLLREIELDDLNEVIERIMLTFESEIAPIAVELMQNLCFTFTQLMHVGENGVPDDPDERGDAEDAFSYRSMVATSVIDNMESVLQIAEDKEEIIQQLEPIVVHQIQLIFDHELSMFYEEAFGLLYSLTASKVSQLTWQFFDRLFAMFQKDSADCFSEMVPCLHNYITVDRTTFISDLKRVEAIATMCSQIIQDAETDEDSQALAAKLLEVLLLDYRGQINSYAPRFIELALTRLTRPITSNDLRVICIQVVVAGFLYAPSDVLPIMMKHHWPGTSVPVLVEFLKLWLQDANAYFGLHDRRLCVLGLCVMLSLPVDQRPDIINAYSKDYLPILLVLFSGLKRAYAAKAQTEKESDDEDNEVEEDDLDSKALGSDEDEIDEEGASYLELLEAEDDTSDVDEDGDELTELEAYDTDLDKAECEMDEFVTFYRVMTELEQTDPAWYSQLVDGLTDGQKNELKDVIGTALKCIQQKESKMIEQAGGYVFHPTIPSSFNFGAPPGAHS